MDWKDAGPMHWEELADILAIDIYLCREGTHQSPININNALDHSPSQLLTDFSPTPIRIINNGHTIHLSYDPGSNINWKSKRYENNFSCYSVDGFKLYACYGVGRILGDNYVAYTFGFIGVVILYERLLMS